MGKQFLEIAEKEKVEGIVAELSAKLAKQTEKEKVAIDEALGRIASTDIFSVLNIPPFDRATMDGYAVVAADTFYADENNPASLIIKGYIPAGELPSQDVECGYCLGISTGAPIPKGANAVVKIENTFFDDGEIKKVKIYKPVAPNENLMLACTDIKRGERIVKKGTTLTPRETGVLAACGLNEVSVVKKPKVAIISTGNEILVPGEDLKPGKIYDVNAHALSDSVRDCGCVPLALGIARDSVNEISGSLKEALKRDVDVIIASGSTSAGVGDLLPKVIEELGEIIVHGVDIKPGKPLIFGLIRGKPVFGLPGNPTSALVTFNLFAAPLLRTIAGIRSLEEGERRSAKAAIRIFSERGRNEYVLVNLIPINGELLAYPILSGSGAITTLSKADGYIYMAKGKEIIEEGEMVEVKLLTNLYQLKNR
ncbi:molybdopterin molybdenumtransferase MoeA [ANME-1 cluster archaeon AG-394-G21]|nr:molybdopterin molybdenumtransferase MoeA [ANME-1 cluster archaeon AG-394-G21]